MAEKKLTLKDAFEELMGYMARGISELDARGVTKDKAAELTERILSQAVYTVNAANAPQAFPPGGPAAFADAAAADRPNNGATDKAAVLRQFKADVARLGITPDDLDEAFGQGERQSPRQEKDQDTPDRRHIDPTGAQPQEPNPKLSPPGVPAGQTEEQTNDPPPAVPGTGPNKPNPPQPPKPGQGAKAGGK